MTRPEQMTRFVRDTFLERSPEAMRMANPRPTRAPKDFCEPDEFAVMACSCAEHIKFHGTEDQTTTAMHVMATEAIKYKVPMFFPSPNLLDALMRTEAPEDLLLSELQWPLPALVFNLPREFSRKYFGHVVPLISMARVPPRYECDSLLVMEGIAPRKLLITSDDKPGSDLYFAGGIVFENNAPAYYAQHAPIEGYRVGDCMTPTLNYYNMVSEAPDPAHDVPLTHKIVTLAINLIMAMTARPDLVDPEQRLLRPKQVHAGRTIHEALWSPRMIGGNFRLKLTHWLGGHHASPGVHWRVGHWRKQRHGPGLCFVKPLWILGVQVGLKTA